MDKDVHIDLKSRLDPLGLELLAGSVAGNWALNSSPQKEQHTLFGTETSP